jgi:Xaa-Pro dipeptidase
MDEALCREHIEKLRTHLERAGADALYVTSPGSNLYYTGVPMGPSDRVMASIITRDNAPCLIVPGFEANRITNMRIVGEIASWEEHEDPFALIADVLAKLGCDSGTLALDGQTWYGVLEGLRQAMPNARFINGQPLIDRCRMIKNERELGFMEEACAITGKALASAVAELKEGMTELEFAELIAHKYRTEGGVHGGSLVQSGPSASDPHLAAGERPITRGDAVVLDSGCQLNDFCSDVTRTLMVGDVPDEVRTAWAVLKDAQQAALDAIRPGATCESIDAAARRWLTKRGYGDYFTHRLGHGIGLDGHEHPYLVGGNRLPLEPGITTTVEPGIYVPGKFGLRIEDVMVVTDDGCRVLSHTVPRDTHWPV